MTASILLRRVLPNGTTTYERVDGELIRLHPIPFTPAARRELNNNKTCPPQEAVPGDAVMKETHS